MPKTIRAEAQAPVSPARRELADALSELSAARRGVEAARAPVPQLENEIAVEAAARAALDRLDADYARRMATWAGDGAGDPPDPDLDARAGAKAALDAAAVKGRAARDTLAALATCVAVADRRLGEATGRIGPAVAAVLREEGAWLAAEYWRRYADLEHARRDLAALDQVLMTDYPIAHLATGRTIVDWVSPEKLSAAALARAVDAACDGIDGVPGLIRSWRERAEMLMR